MTSSYGSSLLSYENKAVRMYGRFFTDLGEFTGCTEVNTGYLACLGIIFLRMLFKNRYCFRDRFVI